MDMQVSPDKNVRVTQADPIGQIPVSPEHAASLKNGDFLVATVEQVRGDTLLLRVDDGSLLNASLAGDMSLAQGDVIEAAVSKDGGTCLLYIVNVLHTGTRSAGGGEASVTPQTLSAVLSILKRNPGLDADIARFMTENSIPDTAENIAALTQMSRGRGIGALLGQILGWTAQQSDTAPAGSHGHPAAIPTGNAAAAPQGETVNTPPGGGDLHPVTGALDQGQANGARPGMGENIPAQTAEPGANTAPAGPNTAPVTPGGPQANPQTGTMAPSQPPGMNPDGANVKSNPIPGAQTAEMPGSQNAVGSGTQEAQAGQGTVRANAGPKQGAAGTIQSQEGPQQAVTDTVQPQAKPQQAPGGTIQPQAGLPGGEPENPLPVSQQNSIHTNDNAKITDNQPAVTRESAQPRHGKTIPAGPELMGNMTAQAGRGDPGAVQGQDEGIGRLIRGLFFQPGQQTGEEIKRAADDMPVSLKSLKSELIQTDIKYRELCLKNVDLAMRQMEIADRAAHFEHMQIPFAAKEGEHRTAELFVFRRNKSRARSAETGLSILLALDTEHMGRVETLIREEAGNVSLEFRLENPDMTGTFKRHSDPVQKAVEAAGYRLTGIRFAGLKKKTTVLNAGESLSLDAGEAAPGIDVQV